MPIGGVDGGVTAHDRLGGSMPAAPDQWLGFPTDNRRGRRGAGDGVTSRAAVGAGEGGRTARATDGGGRVQLAGRKYFVGRGLLGGGSRSKISPCAGAGTARCRGPSSPMEVAKRHAPALRLGAVPGSRRTVRAREVLFGQGTSPLPVQGDTAGAKKSRPRMVRRSPASSVQLLLLSRGELQGINVLVLQLAASLGRGF